MSLLQPVLPYLRPQEAYEVPASLAKVMTVLHTPVALHKKCDGPAAREVPCQRLALADLILLSKTKYILTSEWSSYSEIAIRLGGHSSDAHSNGCSGAPEVREEIKQLSPGFNPKSLKNFKVEGLELIRTLVRKQAGSWLLVHVGQGAGLCALLQTLPMIKGIALESRTTLVLLWEMDVSPPDIFGTRSPADLVVTDHNLFDTLVQQQLLPSPLYLSEFPQNHGGWMEAWDSFGRTVGQGSNGEPIALVVDVSIADEVRSVEDLEAALADIDLLPCPQQWEKAQRLCAEQHDSALQQ